MNFTDYRSVGQEKRKGGYMKTEIMEIIEEFIAITDEWGGEKIASWKYGNNLCKTGVEECVDEIIKLFQERAEK